MGNWLQLLGLFLIPFGGGIPTGVIFSKDHSIPWPITAATYLLSDILLAFFYEQLMLWAIRTAQRSEKMTQVALQYRDNLVRMGFKNLVTPSPLGLFWLSLGVDPMTSRTVGYFAGHSFFVGWTAAIAGDMIFFGIIMASTLWLNSILGDGTLVAIVITALIFLVPALIERIRGNRKPVSSRDGRNGL